MKVLLVQPPIEDFYTTPIRLYPLGLLYATAVLEKAGAEVCVLDCLTPLKKKHIPVPPSFRHLPPLETIPYFFKGYYRFGLEEAEILARAKAFGPDFIGISSQFAAYYHGVEELARLFKKNLAAPIFIGGHQATVMAADIRRRTPEINFVLQGPAEDCLPGFLGSLGLGLEPAKVDWRKVRPSHHLLPADGYRIGKERYVSLVASRGCPFGCDFCGVERMFGREIRYREVGSILDEMRLLRNQRGIGLFNFEDDNLSFDRTWFLEFLRAAAAEPALQGAELTAMNGLCYSSLDEDVLAAMRKAGFREMNLSLVTKSGELRRRSRRPDLIDSFDKFTSLIKSAQRLGLSLTVYVIIGLPGQTYAEVKETVDSLLGLGVLVGPSVFYLAPGSRLCEEMDVPPAVRDDWNLYRSSAFAVETAELSRGQLLELFSYVRKKNLERKAGRATSPSALQG